MGRLPPHRVAQDTAGVLRGPEDTGRAGLHRPSPIELVDPHGRGLRSLFDSGRITTAYPLRFAVPVGLAAMGIALIYVVVLLRRLLASWADRSEAPPARRRAPA
jgi:hypothetical protein